MKKIYMWDYDAIQLQAYSKIGALLKVYCYVHSKKYKDSIICIHECFKLSTNKLNYKSVEIKKAIQEAMKHCNLSNIKPYARFYKTYDFMNTCTGEIVTKNNKLQAFKYFKQDGKKCHYIVKWCDIQKI